MDKGLWFEFAAGFTESGGSHRGRGRVLRDGFKERIQFVLQRAFAVVQHQRDQMVQG